MSRARAHVKIEGKVQGVYYRACTQQEALALGLAGWVRNCPDGSVEGVIEGDKDKVESLLAWCRQGPPGAKVSALNTEWEAYQGEFSSFDIAPDRRQSC